MVAVVTWAVLAWGWARGEFVGRDIISRSGQDSLGRVAADWETGADDAGNSKCCSRSYELVAIRPEACTVACTLPSDVIPYCAMIRKK